MILDFHRFPVGFSQNTQRNRETHAQLVQLLLDKLGDFMVPSSFAPMTSMNDLWAINRTLIIVYADDWTRSSHPFLWPSIPQVHQISSYAVLEFMCCSLFSFIGMG